MSGIKFTHAKLKENALASLRVFMAEEDLEDGGMYFDVIRGYLEKAMDYYILANGGSKCKCGNIISKSSKSKMCISCYNKQYSKTEKYKEKKRRNRLAERLRWKFKILTKL